MAYVDTFLPDCVLKTVTTLRLTLLQCECKGCCTLLKCTIASHVTLAMISLRCRLLSRPHYCESIVQFCSYAVTVVSTRGGETTRCSGKRSRNMKACLARAGSGEVELAVWSTLLERIECTFQLLLSITVQRRVSLQTCGRAIESQGSEQAANQILPKQE